MTYPAKNYNWKRFWSPRGGSINLDYGGYLADPEGPHGYSLNPTLSPFGEVSTFPCLALLGEPGIGKTSTMESERSAIDDAILAQGGKTLWLDLRSCGSEGRVIDKLFERRTFKSWMEDDQHLHLFLDSLDECLLRVETVAALIVDELRNCPIERLSLRIGCRTAEWPASLLESALKGLWGEDGFGAYELAPLRRTDVAYAAAANEIDSDAFLESRTRNRNRPTGDQANNAGIPDG